MICYVDLTSPTAEWLVAARAVPDDRAAAARHGLTRRRHQSLTVRALARAMLSAESGIPHSAWRFVEGPHGAPVSAVTGSVERSLSFAHSAAMVACAIARHGPIGLDVELMRPDRSILDLARAAFGPAEIGDVEKYGTPSFYSVWVRREAMAKATGQGFGLLVNQENLILPAIDGLPNRLSLGSTIWQTRFWTIDEAYAIGFAQKEPLDGSTTPIPRLFQLAEGPARSIRDRSARS